MNEADLARKIAQHLDSGLEQLTGGTLSRLQGARQKALAAYHPKPRTLFGLAWAGHGGGEKSGGFQPLYRAWVPLTALIFSLLLVNYWQNYYQVGDQMEIDALLLAEDLPVDAYLDNGFDTWLEDTAQQ